MIPIAEATETDRFRFYRGRSMLGTFAPGDYLTVEPAPVADIRPGDVVVFCGADQEGKADTIVHRVVAAWSDGLATQGDNNPRMDAVLVTAGNLLGRVTHVERGGRMRPVHGGRWGLLRARLLPIRRWVRRHGRQAVAFVVGGLYRWLRGSGLVSRLWRPEITKMYLTTEACSVIKYVCSGRTVACWWPDTGRFECRKPYDLVLARPDHTPDVTRNRNHEYLV